MGLSPETVLEKWFHVNGAYEIARELQPKNRAIHRRSLDTCFLVTTVPYANEPFLNTSSQQSLQLVNLKLIRHWNLLTMYKYYIHYSLFTCTLLSGTVPDPCLSDPCDVNANCTREGLLSPNFTCTCREPYSDGDGFNCSSMCAFTCPNTQHFMCPYQRV